MMFALGAVSSAIVALKSLTSSVSSSSQSSGFGQPSANPFDISGSASSPGGPAPAPGGGSQLSPATMSALIAAQSQSSAGVTASASTDPQNALQDLFSQIDGNGDGQISKSEFENALGAGGTNLAQADDVFGKLDKDGNGTVSLDELSSALKGAGGKGGHRHHHVAGSGGSGDTGSADGSKVTMTSPAATTASSTATSSYYLVEQMIQRQAQAISFSAVTPSLSLSA